MIGYLHFQSEYSHMFVCMYVHLCIVHVFTCMYMYLLVCTCARRFYFFVIILLESIRLSPAAFSAHSHGRPITYQCALYRRVGIQLPTRLVSIYNCLLLSLSIAMSLIESRQYVSSTTSTSHDAILNLSTKFTCL